MAYTNATSVLPINGISIDGTGYGASQDNTATFVPGSGSVVKNPVVRRTPTEDGDIQKDVLTADFTVDCELYGDLTSLRTSAPDQAQIIPSDDGTDRLELYGTVEADYDDSTGRTRISARGKQYDTTGNINDEIEGAVGVEGTTGGALLTTP